MNVLHEMKPEQLNENVFKLLGDDWMLITAEKDQVVNTMTAAWGGFGVLWNRDVAYIVIRPQRHTKQFVDHAETFSLCFFNDSYKPQLNYLGTVSGRDEDKITTSKLTITKADSTPYFEEARIVMLCKKLYEQPIVEAGFVDKSIIAKLYPSADYHILYIGEITKVLVDTEIFKATFNDA